ncbi:MAG: hypothetical protein ABSC42_13600 [Tepidisphaeraceae bacterium]|jgi:hypothetical protein
MNRPRLRLAKPTIELHFDCLANRIFSRSDIAQILAQQKVLWNLAAATGLMDFINFLTDTGKLREVVFPFPRPYRREVRYIWGAVPVYKILLSLKPGGYFSHHTALRLHGLAKKIPDSFYINHEQFNTSNSTNELTQESIKAAFRHSPRITKYVAKTDDFRIYIIAGKNTGNLAVIEDDVTDELGMHARQVRFTNLERTLIDATVRPQYAGGLHAVLEAFRLARPKLSVDRLLATLRNLDFIYPYHQAIGFLLERTGYRPIQTELFRQLPMDFDFYLAHGMKKTQYIPAWRLYIPNDF